MENQKLSKLQEEELKIFKVFIDICEKQKLYKKSAIRPLAGLCLKDRGDNE